MNFCSFCRGLCRNPVKVGSALLCGAIVYAQVAAGDPTDIPGRAIGNIISLAGGSGATTSLTTNFASNNLAADVVVYDEIRDEEAARVPGGAMKAARVIIEPAPPSRPSAPASPQQPPEGSTAL